MAQLVGEREKDLSSNLSNITNLRSTKGSLALWGTTRLDNPRDDLDKVCHEPYDLRTIPNIVDYRGWIGLSPPATYHSGDLAVSTGKL